MIKILGVMVLGIILSGLAGVVGTPFGLVSLFTQVGLFFTLLVVLVMLGNWLTRKLDEYRLKRWGLKESDRGR